MAFNYRKLSAICESYCNAIRDPKTGCLDPCASFCEVCTPPFTPLPAIPLPYPPTPAVNAATSGGHPVNKLHLSLIISFSTLAAACFAFCCFAFYRFYKSRPTSRRRRSLQQQQDEGTHDEFLDADHGPVLDHPIWYIRTVGLPLCVINSITVFKYKRGDGLVEGTECSVCLNEFQDDETLRLLPKCNHAFHIPCIDTWLRSHTNCPLCRAGIVSNAAAAAATSFPGPVPEQSVDNPVAVEEAPVVIQESSGELTRERDDPNLDEENETRVENGGNGPETLREEAAVDEVQPMRRSVSLDSLSASMISAAMANAHLRESAGDYSSAAQLEKVKELNTSIVPKKVDVNQGLARLVGGGGSSIGRSLSCSGKVFLSRYTRRRNSLLPSRRFENLYPIRNRDQNDAAMVTV